MKKNNPYIKKIKIIICSVTIFMVSLFGILRLNVNKVYAGCCYKTTPFRACLSASSQNECSEGWEYSIFNCTDSRMDPICKGTTNTNTNTSNSGTVSFESPIEYKNVEDLIVNVIKYALGLVGIITVVMIIIGGFMYMTAAGNEEQIKKAKKIITGAIIGLTIVALALVIVSFVETAIGLKPGI